MTHGSGSVHAHRESTVDDHELAALDALRAFAAIGVLLAHASVPLFFNGTVITWTRAGDVGVSVFFVLSGFLIASSVLRQPRFTIRGYMIRRAARILPLYYVSMLIAFVLIDPTPLLSGAGRADVVSHVFLLHGLSRGMRYSMNGVWWTLTVEWLFYLVMGIVSPLFRRGRYGWFLAIGMIALGVLWRLAVFNGSTTSADSAYYIQQLPGMADLFGVGMLLALIAHTAMLQGVLASAWARGSLLVLSFSFVVVMLVTYNSNKPGYWENGARVVVWPLAFAVGIAGLVACFSTPRTRFHALSRVSGLAYLGTIRFGIYLFHPFVIKAFSDAWFTDGRTVSAVPFILAVLASTVLLSMLFHYGVERPAMVWGRRMARPSPGLRNHGLAPVDPSAVVADRVAAADTNVDGRAHVLPLRGGGRPAVPLVRLPDEVVQLSGELQPAIIVELGIKRGGSTALLSELNRPDKLLAMELTGAPAAALRDYVEQRGLSEVVRPFYGVDQSDRARLSEILAQELGDQQIDLVIDDASHLYDETLSSFETLFPRLRAGGLFVIEDWNASDLIGDELAARLNDLTSPDHDVIEQHLQESMDAEEEDPGLRRIPLTQMVVELVVARASLGDAISEVTINGNWVVVRRGADKLDPETFRLADHVHDHFGFCRREATQAQQAPST